MSCVISNAFIASAASALSKRGMNFRPETMQTAAAATLKMRVILDFFILIVLPKIFRYKFSASFYSYYYFNTISKKRQYNLWNLTTVKL